MELVHEMTCRETIEGPWGPTTGSPLGDRLCWQVTAATLTGPRIDAHMAFPGSEWLRLGSDGNRRQDLRVTLATDAGEPIMFSYDLGILRASAAFAEALANGHATAADDQYMRIAPRFDTGVPELAWLMESLFVGQGRLTGPGQIEYEIFRVT